ncbi:MAG: TRAP transporter large permease subunit, partial [Rickettsiales bacterium]|nr:TRAP transporter large permease subunit [Rickettsiales bacterium]
GNFSTDPVSIADLFMGALFPGLLLVILYIFWLLLYSMRYPERVPPVPAREHETFRHVIAVLLPPLLLIMIVLGSILTGIATATESAAVGATGSFLLAATHRRLTMKNLKAVMRQTARVTSMVFTILIGAAMFTLVFRGLHGDDLIHYFLSDLPGGLWTALALTMLVMFVLGFFLDFIEIIFVVVPIVAPILLVMGAHPIWLAIMIAVNLQTSFLTPPFGFSLFYLRGVAPDSVKTSQIYRGVLPFVLIQLLSLLILAIFPALTTWLPETLYKKHFTIEASHAIPDNTIQTYDIDF